jgi:hypothetical protein
MQIVEIYFHSIHSQNEKTHDEVKTTRVRGTRANIWMRLSVVYPHLRGKSGARRVTGNSRLITEKSEIEDETN